jgi:hypothetical protein
VAACGSDSVAAARLVPSSGSSSAASSPWPTSHPFSGADAALGPTYLASCYGATAAINQAGGVLGHTLTCKSVDTRGDPADAVPAVNQMFASTPNLALVIGCTSDEAASVAPVINAHKMAMFCMTGQSEFDHVHYPYFYRLVPPDLEESYAMVAIAQQLHYKRIALAFGNDIGSQTFIQPAISALKKAGITLTTNQTLDLKATTFRSEAIIQCMDRSPPRPRAADRPSSRRSTSSTAAGDRHRHLGDHLAFFSLAARSRRLRVRVPPAAVVSPPDPPPGVLEPAVHSRRKCRVAPVASPPTAPAACLRRDPASLASLAQNPQRLWPGHHQDQGNLIAAPGVLSFAQCRPARGRKSIPGTRGWRADPPLDYTTRPASPGRHLHPLAR